MPSRSVGYHTRLDATGEKVVGGTFAGGLDQETLERLVRAHFTVAVKPSGGAVFVDKQGRRVRLYLSCDPESTEAGKAALREHRRAAAARQEEEELREERESEEIRAAMSGLSHEEALRRLRGEAK